MKILAIDPGGTTGFALYSVGVVTADQLGPDEHHWRLERRLDNLRPSVLIYERFEHRNAPFAKLISNEYIGVIKCWAQKNPEVKLVAQGSSQAKHWATDNKLAALGLLLKPLTKNRNANDATRHFVYFVCHNRRAPRELREKYMDILRELVTGEVR